MHSKRYVPQFRLMQFEHAYEYSMVSEDHKKRSKMRNVIRFLLTIDQVILDDPYAQENFDYVILGDDPLLALTTALHLARRNKSVLIHRTQTDNLPPEFYPTFKARSDMYNPYFITRMGLTNEDEILSLEGLLRQLCVDIQKAVFDTHRPLVMISDPTVGLHSYGTSKGQQETLWAEYRQPSKEDEAWEIAQLGLPRFSFHGESKGKRHNSNPKCRIFADNAIATSLLDKQITTSFNCPLHLIGEAARPIGGFKQFTIRDRIFDVVETELFKIENEVDATQTPSVESTQPSASTANV
jgi:hypothetical protein